MAIRKLDWANVKTEMENVGKKATTEKKVDQNIYKPKLSPENTADVILRFLPAPVGDIDTPIALVQNHSFSVGDKYLGEKCPQTLSKTMKCPICEAASREWKSGDQEFAKDMFKKPTGYVNILIIKDLNARENDGKVFVMKLTKGLHKMLTAKFSPEPDPLDPDVTPDGVNIFDYETGLNFKLRVRPISFPDKKTKKIITTVGYDSSTFVDTPTRLGTDAEINDIDSRLIPLKPYMEDGLKSYADLQERLNRLTGSSSEGSSQSTQNDSYVPAGGSSTASSASLPYGASSAADDDAFLKDLMKAS
jgi:hypothetical protein